MHEILSELSEGSRALKCSFLQPQMPAADFLEAVLIGLARVLAEMVSVDLGTGGDWAGVSLRGSNSV